MRYFFIPLAFFVSVASSQIKKEAAPSLDAYLNVSTDIELGSVLKAPQTGASLHGVADLTARKRTPESVFEEVRENQGRLKYLYKTWKLKDPKGAGNRKFNLVLTINKAGEVEKAVVNGPKNAAFIKDIQANVKTWTFSKVREDRPFVAKLKNLDFMFGNELAFQ